MIFAEIPYGQWDIAKSMTDEQWERFRQLWPGAQRSSTRDACDCHTTQRISWEEAQALEDEFGVTVTVKSFGGTMLTKMSDRHPPETLHNDPRIGDLVSGRTVQIAVSDVGLLLIDEVDWEENCCTEKLQDRLDQGWRILAVCPPNAQRRPDYILGRRKTP